MSTTATTKQRLEYLRRELRAGRMSYEEQAELQGLANDIDDGDVELLEAAGVPEGAVKVLLGPDEIEAVQNAILFYKDAEQADEDEDNNLTRAYEALGEA